MSDREETDLPGGNISGAVRVGNTVRRESGSWTPMVHQLLEHVRGHGFDLAPRPMGLDDRHREVLSYIPGETLVEHPWPAWVWSDRVLVQATSALLRYHTVVEDFRPILVESRLSADVLLADQIVCHNDFAPYNSVFSQGDLVGIIDWDLVTPAHPSWDLAFVAWHWIPLHTPNDTLAWRTISECQRRLRLVADTYGLDDRSQFVSLIVERIDSSRSGLIDRARSGDPAFVRLEADGHADEMDRSIKFVQSISSELRSALIA